MLLVQVCSELDPMERYGTNGPLVFIWQGGATFEFEYQ